MMDEQGWLITDGRTDYNSQYLSSDCGGSWSYSHENAIRFARKQDAEAMARIIKTIKPEFMKVWRVEDHGWYDTVVRTDVRPDVSGRFV